MKKACIFLVANVVLIVNAQPAMANIGPDLNVPLALTLMLLAIPLLSLIGGIYEIFDRKGERKSNILPAAAGIFGVILSAAIVGVGIFVALVVFIYGLMRAVQMLNWGFQAGSFGNNRGYLYFASPLRLIGAGVSLILISVFLTGMAIAFSGYSSFPYTLAGSGYINMEQFVSNHIAYSRLENEKEGTQGESDTLPPLPGRNNVPSLKSPGSNVRIEYNHDNHRVTVYILPSRRFPFFPYNYLISQPSYRADETGEIRMIRVHRQDQICPNDAPVVQRIEDQEIEEAMFYLIDELWEIFEDGRESLSSLRAPMAVACRNVC